MAGSDRTKLYEETQRASLSQLAQGITHLADLSKILQEMTHHLLQQAVEAKKYSRNRTPCSSSNWHTRR